MLKRKLFEVEQDLENSSTSPSPKRFSSGDDIDDQIRSHIDLLESSHSDRLAARNAAHALSQLAKNEEVVSVIVDCGAVPVLVKRLEAPLSEGVDDLLLFEHEVERACAHTLGLLALQSEYQQLIVDAGAIRPLVNLLKRHKSGCNFHAASVVARRAADALGHLAQENSYIKTTIRSEGGIPPLVELLDSVDAKVQRAAAGALRCLAFQNDEIKNQILACNGLPTLVLMLRSADPAIHYEAIGTIGNMVHSSPSIKIEVLSAGALQPVIDLLSSPCIESQREAALLIGQFATADSDNKAHIGQRGALRPLILMLHSDDEQLKEMAAFSIGRLAQDIHNQAGIANNGGIAPLLELVDTTNGSLQHNAAFALYNLADNEDNVADIIRFGGVQILQDGVFLFQITRECVAMTLKRLQEKICGRVLKHLLYLMRNSKEVIKFRVALALAHLCPPDDQKTIFIDNHGLEMLLKLLQSTSLKQQHDASMALYKLATKAASLSHVDAPSMSSTAQVYLGEKYVNNATLSDVTFLIEGKPFYAHRICLLASSDAFRAMFDGGYREKNAEAVEIPNIRWDVFELMMRFIYTGSVNVYTEISHDLLRAADQYLLEGLKRLCESTIAQDISAENIQLMYGLSETYNAVSLKRACIMFMLEQFISLCAKPWFTNFLRHVIPELRSFFTEALSKPIHVKAKVE